MRPGDTREPLTASPRPIWQESPHTAGHRRRAHYRLEDDLRVIDVKVPAVGHLFSGLDPSPPGSKDLAPDVEEYILDAVDEIGRPDRAKVTFHLPGDQLAAADTAALTDAVHNFFAYRAWAAGRNLRQLMRVGSVSFVIGLIFLFACLVARKLLAGHLTEGIGEIVSEGLLISGWVGMWRPIELLLYEWWPIWRKQRRYQRLTAIRIDWREGGRA